MRALTLHPWLHRFETLKSEGSHDSSHIILKCSLCGLIREVWHYPSDFTGEGWTINYRDSENNDLGGACGPPVPSDPPCFPMN